MISPSVSEKERAKRIIVEIIRQAGGSFELKTNLYKAFYYAHLQYAEQNPDYLSAWPIVRMPNGPGIDGFDFLVGELLVTGHVHLGTIPLPGGCEGSVFEITELVDSYAALSESEIAAIRYGINCVVGKSATQTSQESHDFSRSWREAKNGEELNIYGDSLSDAEFAERQESMSRLVGDYFKSC